MGSGELLGELVTMLGSSLWWTSMSSREGEGGWVGAIRFMPAKLDGAKCQDYEPLGLNKNSYFS